MKKFYTTILIANLVIESIGAGALFMAPWFLVDASNASALLWSWNYGFVALAVGGTVFWAWPHRDDFAASGVVLGVLFSFHLAISVALAIVNELFIDIVLHGVFAMLCLYLYTQRSRWCLAPASTPK